ncbi:hypothetical protein OG792_12265 [Micromonospora sp. NBC_01699]|uniref:hypothetical protein n=1 Tax=Micromonospora sp. NBC_01699 TaxID=2975984 RepID=UPI002E34AC8A|nr:hypothetical protein [Micromonospora sp. NBC_01699]
MRAPRFIDFTRQLLERANHPDIAKIDTFNDPGTAMKPCGIVITMTDGSVIRLKAVRTSGPGGDNWDAEEIIPYPEYQIPEDLSQGSRKQPV